MGSEALLALTAADQETAIEEMETLVTKLAEEKISELSFSGRRQLSSKAEVLTWQAAKPKTLVVEIVDDDRLPAMYLRLTGEDATVDEAVELAAKSFDVAWPEDCVAAAEREGADDPSLIVMAALVSDEGFETRLMAVIGRAFESRERDQREAAAKALGIRGTAAGRELLVAKAAAEPDRNLKRKLQLLLSSWPA